MISDKGFDKNFGVILGCSVCKIVGFILAVVWLGWGIFIEIP